MNDLELENQQLKKEIAELKDKVSELSRKLIKLYEERQIDTDKSNGATRTRKHHIILVDNPKKEKNSK